MVDPRVVEKPRDDEKMERLAEKFPGIFLAPSQICYGSLLGNIHIKTNAL